VGGDAARDMKQDGETDRSEPSFEPFSKGRQSPHDRSELGPGRETTAKGLANGLTEELGRELRGGAVEQGTPRRSDGCGAEPGAISGRHLRDVDRDSCGHAQSPMAPGFGQGQVNLRRQQVREAVQGQGCMVRDDARPLRPEPDRDEIFVFTRRVVDQPIDAPANAGDPALVNVVREERRRVPCLGSLPGGEQAFLGSGGLVKTIPVGLLAARAGHARMLNGV